MNCTLFLVRGLYLYLLHDFDSFGKTLLCWYDFGQYQVLLYLIVWLMISVLLYFQCYLFNVPDKLCSVQSWLGLFTSDQILVFNRGQMFSSLMNKQPISFKIFLMHRKKKLFSYIPLQFLRVINNFLSSKFSCGELTLYVRFVDARTLGLNDWGQKA